MAATKTGWVHFRTEAELEKKLEAEVVRERKRHGVPKQSSKPNRSTVGRDLLTEALDARETTRTG